MKGSSVDALAIDYQSRYNRVFELSISEYFGAS